MSLSEQPAAQQTVGIAPKAHFWDNSAALLGVFMQRNKKPARHTADTAWTTRQIRTLTATVQRGALE